MTSLELFPARRIAADGPELAQSDALEWLAALPDCSVDLVITDPAYASLELHRSKGSTTRLAQSDGSSNEWFRVIPNSYLPRLLEQCYRVLKADRHLYLYCDEVTADIVKDQQGIGEARLPDGSRRCLSGFVYWRELIWAKTTEDGSRIRAGMGYHYRGACERVLFFEKGKRRLNDLGVPDVLLAPRVDGYPTEKSEVVARTLVSQSTAPGELVIDPFMGSGSTLAAALGLGRRAAGCDISPTALSTAHTRLGLTAPAPTAQFSQPQAEKGQ